ncbi:MAG: hypothetical protein QMD82_08070 [bacterium]|nr:hypothetical protein [bacterium]
MSIAPAIFVTPPLPGDALHLKGKINLTHFQIHNPAYTKTIYTTGLSLGSDIKITDKPLKIYLTVQYSNYQGTKKNFAFYNLGFGLRL